MELNTLLQQYKNFETFSKNNLNILNKLHEQGELEKIYELFRTKNKTKNSFEQLKKHSLLCASRYEIKNRFSNIYECIRRNNLLDVLCSHMNSYKLAFSEKVCKEISEQLFKKKCLTNTRKIIPPYELDIFFPDLNIAIEFQGEYWHSRQKVIEIDKLKQTLCSSNNILLLQIYEKGNSHQDNIHLIVEQFREYIPIINKFLGSSYRQQDITENVNLEKIYNSHKNIDLEKEILKFKSLKELSTKKKSLYDRIRKTNKMHLLENIRERKYPMKWKNMTDEDIINLIKKDNFQSFTEFSKKEVYRTVCRRRNLIEKVKKLFYEVSKN